MQILLHQFMLVGVGVFVGLFASSTGSGGLVTLPVLIAFGLPIHTVIATNRLAMVFLDGSGALRFIKEKSFDLRLSIKLGLIASVGSLLGSYFFGQASDDLLSLVTGILLVVIFFIVAFKNSLGLTEKPQTQKSLFLLSIGMFFLGIYVGFLGPGFGTFNSILLVLGGFTFLKSTGMSRVIGFIANGASALYLLIGGYVYMPYAISLGLGLAVGAWFGAGLGLKKGSEFIKGLFLVVALISAVKLLYDYFT